MSSKKRDAKTGSLAKEILGLSAATAVISVFFYGFLKRMADSVVLSYCEKNGIYFTEMQEFMAEAWVKNVSFAASVILFAVLLLFLVGQKMIYLKEIIKGIDALRANRMDYVIPVEGSNEFTILAESINYLSKTEREIQRKEALMKEEKEGLIRALSHDIRTPLTSILSYSEYMAEKDALKQEEIKEYAFMIKQKAQQIKGLTDRLLEGGAAGISERIENGRFLMEQLADEWETELEDEFECDIDMENCPQFSGEIDIQELRRVFDNLGSNINKYADNNQKVYLKIFEKDKRLAIQQHNAIRNPIGNVESRKIGLESIKKIAAGSGGDVSVSIDDKEFFIEIIMFKIV